MPDISRSTVPRVLYAKGGRAIAEATRLLPHTTASQLQGPDQFFLAVRQAFSGSPLRLISVGPHNLQRQFANAQALEYSLRPDTGSRTHRQFLQLIGMLRFIGSTLRWRPDIILAGIEGPMAVASLLIARLLRARLLFLVHTDLRATSLSRAKIALHRFVVKRADAVIVHGPFLRDQLLDMGCPRDRLFEFDTGFDPATSMTPPVSSQDSAGTVTFLYSGRLECDKGIFDLLQAFEAMASVAQAQLVFAGDGGARQGLVQRVAASPCRSAISVLGTLAHADMLTFMQRSTATVTPTQSRLSEGRCMSALESLLVGTPVIAPDLGAFPYLVKHQHNGLLYAPDNVAALAEAMRSVATDSQLLHRLQQGASHSGASLMHPQHTFLSCLVAATNPPAISPAPMNFKFIYLACPCNPIGGGMRRVADYLIQTQHFTDEDGMRQGLAELRALDTRGPGSAASSLLVLGGALLRILKGRLTGRLVGVHVNMAERLSLFRKASIVLFSRAIGLPVILHLHAAQLPPFYRNLPGLLQGLVRWTFARASTVLVLGQASRRFVVDVLRVPAQRVSIVNNGVPDARMPRQESMQHDKPQRLFFLGNLSERKGVSDLIKALGRTDVAYSGNFEAIFGGVGDIERYAALAREVGVAHVCRFAGWVGQQQAATLMAGADVLVLPSYDEGLPLVILEALANSTAVICTPVGEIPHALTDGLDALFVEPGNIDQLAAAIDRVLTDAHLRAALQAGGRASYEKYFSVEQFAETIAGFHQKHFGMSARLSHPATGAR